MSVPELAPLGLRAVVVVVKMWATVAGRDRGRWGTGGGRLRRPRSPRDPIYPSGPTTHPSCSAAGDGVENEGGVADEEQARGGEAKETRQRPTATTATETSSRRNPTYANSWTRHRLDLIRKLVGGGRREEVGWADSANECGRRGGERARGGRETVANRTAGRRVVAGGD
ncbi:hypothetical protein B0H16DRAFT_1464656 [Mycena metata]|uniref:Uncharacterized protein n=1 Tax=Mycena metata TaxID=1033252 RepID=A0AAD7IE92_9AGAR|nr:hypothetical protein B0H16DRAFT_1464656 [Mycena metata]